jgi:UDP-2,4-diacetamido-2,4,6-trideoxy-beta-L-altropyranose hydrolase
MGHLVRCLSLAKILKNEFDISFLLTENVPAAEKLVKEEYFNVDAGIEKENAYFERCDAVVLDGYEFKEEIQKRIKAKHKKLVFIDDLHDQHFFADAIINVSDSVIADEYIKEANTKLLLGSKYALLRPEFIQAAKEQARTISNARSIFISMGGADKENSSLKVLKALESIKNVLQIHLLIGAVNQNEITLKEYITRSKKMIVLHKDINAGEIVSILNRCQIAICPASGTSIEAAAVGIGMISGITADNQKGILNGLINNGCAESIGNFNEISGSELTAFIEKTIANVDATNEMIVNQKKLVDGHSPERYLRTFHELLNGLTLTKPTEKETELYFRWANDEMVRQNSYETGKISYEDHVAWFKRKLISPDCFFYLFMMDNDPAGQVRIENKEKETVIGISLDEKFRGKGLASEMLEMACSDFFVKFPNKTVNAYIKQENTASLATFKKAGFAKEEKVQVNGASSIKLSKVRTYEL